MLSCHSVRAQLPLLLLLLLLRVFCCLGGTAPEGQREPRRSSRDRGRPPQGTMRSCTNSFLLASSGYADMFVRTCM